MNRQKIKIYRILEITSKNKQLLLFFSQCDDLAHELLRKKSTIIVSWFCDKMLQTSFDGLYTCIHHSLNNIIVIFTCRNQRGKYSIRCFRHCCHWLLSFFISNKNPSFSMCLDIMIILRLPSSKNGKLGIFTSYGSGDCGGVENTSKSEYMMVKL